MSVTNQEGPLEPGKDTAEPSGNSYPLKRALFSFTVTKPVTLSRLEEKGHVNFSSGGDSAYNTLTGFSPLAESAELRGIEGVGHFLLGSA